MPQTRMQTGQTPRKTVFPDMVETPGRTTPSRKSLGPDLMHDADNGMSTAQDSKDTVDITTEKAARRRKTDKAENGSVHADGHADGHANGYANGKAKEPLKLTDGWAVGLDPKIDYSGHFEFCGSWGVSILMIGFPLLMYYMWIGATYFDGKAPLPQAGESLVDFVKRLANLAYEGAYPSAKAWAMYWTFFVVEGIFYLFMPGVYQKGKPLPHEGGKQLDYYCSALWSFHSTTAIFAVMHFTGIFKLQTIIDEFGPLMSVSILTGFLMSFYFYFSALIRGRQHRMSGYPIYDFFMGAELNPRLFYWLDFKMFFEVRIPWYMLYLVSLSAAARQYDQYGYVSAEVGFLVYAHWLYANACSKGEEIIPPCWDMYYEKLGFMLAFWNLSGVPLSYCHAAVYMANHHPSTYHWNKYLMMAWFIVYSLVYWIWDTSNCQKNRFRSQETGVDFTRKAFPQLPWQIVKNPRTIRTARGTILVDGWYGMARKIPYTCDIFFALSWALVTGFESPFPWFYPFFFCVMITHRCWRDVQRCRIKYGDAWKKYEEAVPYLLIPYVI